MERNYCWGTILPRVFRGIINSLKKFMCKILLIKTKPNPYQCSADFTNKVTSRTGRCRGHAAASHAQEQPPTWVLGLAGSCDHGALAAEGAGGRWHLQSLEGQLWRLWTVRKCWGRSCGRSDQGGEGSKDLGRAGSAQAPPLLWGQDSVTNPTQHGVPGVGTELPPLAQPHGDTRTRSTHPGAVTAGLHHGCPAATSSSAHCPPPSLAFLSSPGIVQHERKELRSLV